ncbi:metallophosphoesterase [Vibrio coralliilyticus]|uniref:metallophosphoesterase family protein n=1 Tax=Vibrio coralliilyticus TaxID=190893 RepID=UPI00155FAC0D|nr:metallophosphoesterase [Vibrio coralliilyticus]NRF27868.1 metallophosphoesterase [Vibrio coralliilyticus]NRF81957.1 metallophosphoesterase [Vibrio coralliilyticus]
MRRVKHALVAGTVATVLTGCPLDSSDDQSNGLDNTVEVAFMPDIHFHDVYSDFQDGSFEGLFNAKSGDNATIRTMQSQMESTRLFNENYFAMIAALDDIVDRGIKYVALPGDFSDDGQPVNMRGLVQIFDYYRSTYGLEFFAAPGNHDPSRPFTIPAGKSDYLGEEGQEQPIYSRGKDVCVDYSGDTAVIDTGNGLPTICTEEVRYWGYREIMDILGTHGFYPQESYHYFETPYTSDELKANYSYERAAFESTYDKRMFEICHQGTGGEYKQDNYTNCSYVPDTSYLVEPVKGLWLLAIDANVYQPKQDSASGSNDGDDFEGSSSAGYNMMLTHKQQVIEWISEVVKAAKEQNKTLVSFSHFPMTDFYNGASEEIEDLFGEGSHQLAREPDNETSKALAATGLNIHVGGHMHFNDTGKKTYNINGVEHTLFNIQAPSLAGYIPAYKVLKIRPDQQIEVETVVIDEVARFDELFEHYAVEHEHLTDVAGNDEEAKAKIWNKEILDSESYYQLVDWHIKELTRLRFLPDDWPLGMRNMIMHMDGKEMMIMSQLETNFTVCALADELDVDVAKCQISPAADFEQFEEDWEDATAKAKVIASDAGLSLDDFASWQGQDLAIDFYRLRNADELAFRDIETLTLQQYELLSRELSEFAGTVESDIGDIGDYTVGQVFRSRFGSLFVILDKFATGQASDHFLINIEQQSLTDLKQAVEREIMQ